MRLVGAVLMEHNDDWQTQNSLHADRGLRRAGRQARRPQAFADYTQGGLTNEPLSYTRKLHHIDGRDHTKFLTVPKGVPPAPNIAESYVRDDASTE